MSVDVKGFSALAEGSDDPLALLVTDNWRLGIDSIEGTESVRGRLTLLERIAPKMDALHPDVVKTLEDYAVVTAQTYIDRTQYIDGVSERLKRILGIFAHEAPEVPDLLKEISAKTPSSHGGMAPRV